MEELLKKFDELQKTVEALSAQQQAQRPDRPDVRPGVEDRMDEDLEDSNDEGSNVDGRNETFVCDWNDVLYSDAVIPCVPVAKDLAKLLESAPL